MNVNNVNVNNVAMANEIIVATESKFADAILRVDPNSISKYPSNANMIKLLKKKDLIIFLNHTLNLDLYKIINITEQNARNNRVIISENNKEAQFSRKRVPSISLSSNLSLKAFGVISSIIIKVLKDSENIAISMFANSSIENINCTWSGKKAVIRGKYEIICSKFNNDQSLAIDSPKNTAIPILAATLEYISTNI
jgi:hypothetical protein